MNNFIPADTLKKQFNVFGHFYTIEIQSFCRIECRSVLEIVSNDFNFDNNDDLSEKKPDAIFIMMNPGSSKPLSRTNNIISSKKISKLEISLVPAKPDTTQYQIMRIMRHMNWEHVRVLNLSDLIDSDSINFIKKFTHYENKIQLTSHSIFADSRKEELKLKLRRKAKAPIICSWGTNPGLNTLIERCLKKIRKRKNLKGLLKETTSNKYYHPLPEKQINKEKWVKDMVKELKSEPDTPSKVKLNK